MVPPRHTTQRIDEKSATPVSPTLTPELYALVNNVSVSSTR